MKQPKPNRITINRNVKPSTVKLLVKLARKLDTDQGRVIDRAIVGLMMAENTVAAVKRAARAGGE